MPRNLVAFAISPKTFKFAEFTLTKADAQKHLYADSTKHRVHKWKDVKVALYI